MSTLVLRRFLSTLGYATYGWELGRNIGPTARVVSGLPERYASRPCASHAGVSSPAAAVPDEVPECGLDLRQGAWADLLLPLLAQFVEDLLAFAQHR
jgi:hypothetical protein